MAGPWDVVKVEPASDPWAVVSSAPAPNATGLANQALQGTGISVGPPKSPAMNVNVSGDNPAVRAAVAAGATLPNNSGPRTDPASLMQSVANESLLSPNSALTSQLPAGTPSSLYNTATEPFKRIASGDTAGGVGQLGGIGAQAYLLKKAGDVVQSATPEPTPAGGDLMKQAASQRFSEVSAKAGTVPVDLTGPGNVALRIQELAQSGGSMPKVVRDFLRRTTDPTQQPLTYAEARDFYSNATRLSADEFNRLTPVMRAQVGQFTNELGKSISGAATSAGQGENYATAMRQYRAGSNRIATEEQVGAYAKKLVAYGIPTGIAGYVAKEILSRQGR